MNGTLYSVPPTLRTEIELKSHHDTSFGYECDTVLLPFSISIWDENKSGILYGMFYLGEFLYVCRREKTKFIGCGLLLILGNGERTTESANLKSTGNVLWIFILCISFPFTIAHFARVDRARQFDFGKV